MPELETGDLDRGPQTTSSSAHSHSIDLKTSDTREIELGEGETVDISVPPRGNFEIITLSNYHMMGMHFMIKQCTEVP